jgi:hypothetical protein
MPLATVWLSRRRERIFVSHPVLEDVFHFVLVSQQYRSDSDDGIVWIDVL